MSEDVDWDKKVEEVLKMINIEENDFKKVKGSSQVHEKIIEAIEEEWSKYRQPIFKEKKQLLDFVGRQIPQYGKIELAVEVDTWHKPSDNWRKLLDIRAKKKIWIYLAKNPKEADENFEEALKEFRKLAKIRGEDESNNVTIFMKVPGRQEVKKVISSNKNAGRFSPASSILTKKTYAPRLVFIPRDLAARLRGWIKWKGTDPCVFYSEHDPDHPLNAEHVRRAFQNALLKLGYLERDPSNRGWEYTIHGLRRSFKTILQNAGMDGLKIEILLGHDTGINRSYYRPSEKELAEEWKKFENYLLLESPGPSSSQAEKEEIIKLATLSALEQTWIALNPGQPPEDLYVNAARFTLGHYPNVDEKISIVKTAIQTYIRFVKEYDHHKIASALKEAMRESRARK